VFIAGLSPFAAISNAVAQNKIQLLQWGAEYFEDEINTARIKLADLLKSFDSSIAFFIHRTNKQAFDILTNAMLQRKQIIPKLKSSLNRSTLKSLFFTTGLLVVYNRG
jgi:hypothetical protein